MFKLQVQRMLSAAHRLENYQGPCSNLHGHNWLIIATWKVSDDRDNNGISIDLSELKNELGYATRGLDHVYLNKVVDKPTAENLAILIHTRLAAKHSGKYLQSVAVEESPGNRVTYEGEGDAENI